jgi:ubiquinol-cytochrome c reductase cytochrome b subunit
MRILKSNPVLTIFNSYLVDNPEPSTISYLWNFGSLLGLCLVSQIVTGILLAMHYQGSASMAFLSVEHIMRDVNDGWLLRMVHANMASFFFIAVYAHISRGLYYGSYRSPRIGVWVIGTIIFFLMMATKIMWPKWMLKNNINYYSLYFISSLPLFFNKPRIKGIYRIGPHNIDALSVLICGMLGDWWGDIIKGQHGDTVRFNIEQSISNSAYIHHLTYLFLNWGYSSYLIPKLVKKSESEQDKRSNILMNRYNYRLTLFTYSSLMWIYSSFYEKNNGKIIKKVPVWIEDYITPIGLAHWIMQDGSRQNKQGINIATHSFTKEECQFLSEILNRKYKLKSTVVKTGYPHQWRISIWKESMPTLVSIVKPYIIDEMKYKFIGYI